MVAMTQDPVDSGEAPIRGESLYMHSRQWTYTSAGTGALELTTGAIAPDDHPCWIHRIEVDTIGTVPSTSFVLFIEFPAGHEYENHSYRLDGWSATAGEHHVVTFYNVLPIPPGAIFRMTASASGAGVEYQITCLLRWE